MSKPTLELLRGTLDILVLKTLSWQPLHGYAISQIIRKQTEDALLVEEGALYPALYRMEAKGWIQADWGLSDFNRRAKFYALTPQGRKHLRAQAENWRAYTTAVSKILDAVRPPVPGES